MFVSAFFQHPVLEFTDGGIGADMFGQRFIEQLHCSNVGKVRIAAGHFGDMMANACMVSGFAGVIINGSCRDNQDILELKYPVYAKAYCPAPTTKKTHAVMNEPMDICGAHICPGDLVFADGDGIVIIPQEKEDAVIEKALAKFAKEKEILTRIKNGESTMKIYGFDQIR